MQIRLNSLSTAFSARNATSAVDHPLLWWSGLVAMLAMLLLPVRLVEVPPLTDYPNHLARCYVLAYGGADPILHRKFTEHWRIVPNLAIDLLLPSLMHLFPIFAAGRVIVVLSLLLPITGAVALSYSYFRRRSFWQIAVGFIAFNPFF